MRSHSELEAAAFDLYALDYDQILEQGLKVSGEGKDFFARGRAEWLARCLTRLHERPARILDYGCGTGNATRFLLELPGARHVTGTDTSSRSLEIARANNEARRSQFTLIEDIRSIAPVDLAFCNGVFHHVPPSDRGVAVNQVWTALRPGGYFALWENNPWNPGARYVMRRLPFDRDAVLVSAREARSLLASHGFSILRMDFLFIFPAFLKALRPLEAKLSRLPLGAQYQVLAQKPVASQHSRD